MRGPETRMMHDHTPITDENGQPTRAILYPSPDAFGDMLEKTEDGYVYTFFADGVDYKALKNYVKQLEEAGFGVYNSTPLELTKTEDLLPDKLDEGTYSAKWIGNRRGLYVAITWYADEYYEANNLPKDNNIRLYFYTYNAFKTN